MTRPWFLAAMMTVLVGSTASAGPGGGGRTGRAGKDIDVQKLGSGWGTPKPVDRAEAARLGRKLYGVAERAARGKDGRIDLARLGKPFHTKTHLSVKNATAEVYSRAQLAERFRSLGLPARLLDHPAMSPRNNPVFTPGRSFEGVWFRYSAAPGDRNAKDGKGGFHGVAIRLFADRGGKGFHDLLLTNANPAHISDEHQQVAFASGLSHITHGVKTGAEGAREAAGAVRRIARRERGGEGKPSVKRGLGAVRAGTRSVGQGARELWSGLGPLGTIGTFATLARQGRRPIDSIFTEVYHGRTPNQFGINEQGEPVAVKYRLVPLRSRVARDEGGGAFTGGERLGREGAAQIARSDVELELQIQYFVGSKSTPIDNARIRWKNSPFIPVMKFRIPAQDVRAAKARGEWKDLEDAGFNPGNVLAEGYLPVGPGAMRPAVYEEVQRLRREEERSAGGPR